jgi:hypothetical protein
MATAGAIGVKIIFARKKPNFSRTGSLLCQVRGLVPLNLSAYLSRMVNLKDADLVNARKNGFGNLSAEFNLEKFHLIAFDGFYGRYVSTNYCTEPDYFSDSGHTHH